ncbi:MAG TPA: M24 family metallopeptidase [Acidimicrobiales bacterium]
MSELDAATIEGVGERYDVESMMDVRRRTRLALRAIAEQCEVGMTERQARTMARDTLDALDLRRGWHPTLVRFGPNTVREFLDRDGGDVRLREADIFFIDIGPVFNELEGDAGETFTTGADLDFERCARDVRAIWDEVREGWFVHRLSGRRLYEFAAQRCAERGWVLNLELTGHRISDYPHKVHFAGAMSEVELVPSSDLWVLEIGLAHPNRTYGAFYEDTLLADQSF